MAKARSDGLLHFSHWRIDAMSFPTLLARDAAGKDPIASSLLSVFIARALSGGIRRNVVP